MRIKLDLKFSFHINIFFNLCLFFNPTSYVKEPPSLVRSLLTLSSSAATLRSEETFWKQPLPKFGNVKGMKWTLRKKDLSSFRILGEKCNYFWPTYTKGITSCFTILIFSAVDKYSAMFENKDLGDNFVSLGTFSSPTWQSPTYVSVWSPCRSLWLRWSFLSIC